MSKAFWALAVLSLAGAAAVAEDSFDPEKLHRAEVWGDGAFRHAGAVTHLAVMPGGRQVLSSARDGTARLWDAESGKEIRRFYHPKDEDIWCAVSLPGGREILTAGGEGQVTQWEIETGRQVRIYAHAKGVYRLVVAPDGLSFFACDANNEIVRWNLKDGEEMARFKGHTESVYGIAVSPDGSRLYSAGDDKTLRVWDVKAAGLLQTLVLPEDVYTVALNRDGTSLAVTCNDKNVRVFNTADLSVRWAMPVAGTPYFAAWSPDGTTVVSLRREALDVFAADKGESAPVGHETDTRWAAAFSPDGRTLYYSSENLVCRADPSKRQRTWPDPGLPRPVAGDESAFYVPARREILLADESKGTFRFFSPGGAVSTNAPFKAGLDASRWRMAMMSDGRTLAAAPAEGEIALLDTVSGQLAYVPSSSGESGASALAADPSRTRYFEAAATVWVTDLLESNRVSSSQLFVPKSRERGPGEFVSVSRGDCEALYGSLDGGRLAAVYDETIHVVDTGSRHILETIKLGESEDVNDLIFVGADHGAMLASIEDRLSYWPSMAGGAAVAGTNEVLELLGRLGASSYAEREAATQRFVDLGPAAVALARSLPQDDPEIRERLKMVQASLSSRATESQREASVSPERPCKVLRALPGSDYWLAILGTDAEADVAVGSVRDGQIVFVKKIRDEHGPARLLPGPKPNSAITANRDGTFSVYEW